MVTGNEVQEHITSSLPHGVYLEIDPFCLIIDSVVLIFDDVIVMVVVYYSGLINKYYDGMKLKQNKPSKQLLRQHTSIVCNVIVVVLGIRKKNGVKFSHYSVFGLYFRWHLYTLASRIASKQATSRQAPIARLSCRVIIPLA